MFREKAVVRFPVDGSKGNVKNAIWNRAFHGWVQSSMVSSAKVESAYLLSQMIASKSITDSLKWCERLVALLPENKMFLRALQKVYTAVKIIPQLSAMDWYPAGIWTKFPEQAVHLYTRRKDLMEIRFRLRIGLINRFVAKTENEALGRRSRSE